MNRKTLLCIQVVMMVAFTFNILTIFPPGIDAQEANTNTLKNIKTQFTAAGDEINARNRNVASSESDKELSASRGGKDFIYGDLKIHTDKKQDQFIRDTCYEPGSIAQIDTAAPRGMLNGSVKWRLESPSEEEVFDFGSQAEVNVNETKTQATRTGNYTREGVTSTLTSNVTTLIESSSHVYVNISLQLPEFPLNFGYYWFSLVVFGKSGPEIVESRYNATIIITDLTSFAVDTAFVQRGWRNDSVVNYEKTYRYVEEPDTTVFSPGDNVTLIGRINCSTAPDMFYRSRYMNLTTSSRILKESWNSQTWNSTIFPNTDPISWNIGYLRQYNTSKSDPAHGNFVFNGLTPEELDYYYALNFVIPERGIYGMVNFTISMFYYCNHTSMYNSWGYRVKVFDDKSPCSSIEIRYHLNVTANDFQNDEYLLTEYMSGNFTVKPLNFNLDKINESDPIWNENATLNIPLNDIHFRLYMNNSVDDEKICSFSSRHSVNYTYEWMSGVDVNLRNGTYNLWLEWLDPLKSLNDTVNSVLEWTVADSTLFIFNGGFYFPVEIKGSLAFRDMSVVNGTLTNITQDSVGSLKCKIWFKELNKYARGLGLYGLLDNNMGNGKFAVIEKDGIYNVYFDTALNETIGEHTMYFYKSLTGEELGHLTFIITEKEKIVIPVDPKGTIGTILGIIAAGAVVIAFVGIVIIFVKPFKK